MINVSLLGFDNITSDIMAETFVKCTVIVNIVNHSDVPTFIFRFILVIILL